MKVFYYILANVLIANIVNMTVWFAIIFFVYLQTESVFATSIISGVFLVAASITGFWFGSLVDNNKKKHVMLSSSLVSLIAYIIGFIVYVSSAEGAFKRVDNPWLWVLIVVLLAGVIAGNLRSIALPTLVTILIDEDKRDKANGLAGTVSGIAMLIVSVISAFLVGQSGMFAVLILAMATSVIVMVHLYTITIPEKEPVRLTKDEATPKVGKLDIRGTIKAIRSVPGLFSLILFTTFNNFLGGVFMSLMDAYGLSLVSVEVWGLLWGFLSTAFIVGGLIIARKGLGKNPLKAMFGANIVIWTITIFFTIQPSILLLVVGMFVYLAVVPFIEAAEQTIIQRVVSPERQGRVFGFAHSIEQTASPLTAFLIGPITQFIFIPFMSDGGQGAELIGSWFGTGSARGIALVFTLTGIIGLTVTLLAMQTKFYRELSHGYRKGK